MLLLFGDDGSYGQDGLGIHISQFLNLALEMAQHDALDSNRCRCNRSRPADRRYESKSKAACPAEVVTAATANTAALQLGLKDRPMPTLMRLEFRELAAKPASRDSRNQELPGVNIDRAILASVIDLEHSLGESIGGAELGYQFHGASRTA